MNKVTWLWLGIAAFGAVGSVARYGVQQLFGLMTDYPAGTLAVNVLGAFVLGWVHASLPDKGDGPAVIWRIVLGAGLLGGFTTFSSMMLDADKMTSSHAYFKAAGYLSASLFLGLAAVRLGAIAARSA